METKYSVGQILFAIDTRRFNITPYQITEHHVKTSLDGTENSYLAVSGRTKEPANLSTLGGPLFENLQGAEDYLTRIAVEKIKKLAAEADNISQKVFDTAAFKKADKNVNLQQEESLNLDDKDQDIVVELPDGRQAKLSKGGSYEDFSS